MVEANNNTESAHQNLLQNKPLGDSSNRDPKGLQENDDKIASIIESMKKLSIAINECPIISYDIAKELGLEMDKSLSNITDRAVSDIVEQVSANQGISRRIPCKTKRKCKARKKLIFNDTTSESSSSSESGSDSESDSRTGLNSRISVKIKLKESSPESGSE
ncbi:hypothetical protein Glove_73g25 [Diversispora epigaea]|uniref:Uncharacterized protein n=1 Tax=Diversispora epigaea TaxID=1348612 RepID=A0A397J9L4_9GLOM|nr:hypothetical protein Glove_73g25 [Diversispora epigaea]